MSLSLSLSRSILYYIIDHTPHHRVGSGRVGSNVKHSWACSLNIHSLVYASTCFPSLLARLFSHLPDYHYLFLFLFLLYTSHPIAKWSEVNDYSILSYLIPPVINLTDQTLPIDDSTSLPSTYSILCLVSCLYSTARPGMGYRNELHILFHRYDSLTSSSFFMLEIHLDNNRFHAYCNPFMYI